MSIDPLKLGELISDVKHIRITLENHVDANDSRVTDLENKVDSIQKWQHIVIGAFTAAGATLGLVGEKLSHLVIKLF
jgi:hypothetical protein